MSKQEMIDWMLDVYLVEGKLTNAFPMRDSAFKLFLPWKDSLIRQKGINDTLLRESYQYYFEHSKELEDIYVTLIDSLSLMEKRFQKKNGL